LGGPLAAVDWKLDGVRGSEIPAPNPAIGVELPDAEADGLPKSSPPNMLLVCDCAGGPPNPAWIDWVCEGAELKKAMGSWRALGADCALEPLEVAKDENRSRGKSPAVPGTAAAGV